MERKFFYGNILLCIDKNNNISSPYLDEVLLYRLSNGNFFYIRDEALASFISLVPEDKMNPGDIYPTAPRCNFDMYIDEKSLKPFGTTISKREKQKK